MDEERYNKISGNLIYIYSLYIYVFCSPTNWYIDLLELKNLCFSLNDTDRHTDLRMVLTFNFINTGDKFRGGTVCYWGILAEKI